MSKKFVYLFSEGDASMRELLGGKGANLAEMTVLGLPIPQGFTVTTEACTEYYNCGKMISKEIEDQIFKELSELEKIEGKVIYHSKILGKFVLYWLKPLVFVYVVIILIITLLKNSFKKEERSTKNESQKENEENKNIGIN